MKHAVSSVFVPLALLALLDLSSLPASAAVCYEPQSRGFSTSRYQLDTLTSAWLAAPMDFSADPWEAAGSEFLDYERPEVFAAYVRRYGPQTACLGGLVSTPECGGHVFKRFAGPGNEVRSLLADALAWWASYSPGTLGGGGPCRSNGVPSEREITDLQAVADSQIWETYHQLVLPGGAASRPLLVCRSDRAPGAFTERDSFWGWTSYFVNTCGQQQTNPPPPAPSTCTAPPQAVLDAAKRVRNRSTAKQAGQLVIDWLTAASRCRR
jgi:hypothetical protein